ncbi:unnamed protein product, partial [Sphagnum compactum]
VKASAKPNVAKIWLGYVEIRSSSFGGMAANSIAYLGETRIIVSSEKQCMLGSVTDVFLR